MLDTADRTDTMRALDILFVENHEAFASTVTEAFLGAHVVEVVSSVAAAIAATTRRNYDVALVDYDLDDGKGDEFVKHLRATGSTMLLIGVSSHAPGNDALSLVGADATCAKLDFATIGGTLERFAIARSEPG